MSYTIQHIKTGKYISSLMSDSISDTFRADHPGLCYQWNSYAQCARVAAEINLMVGHVVKGLEVTERNIVVRVVEV